MQIQEESQAAKHVLFKMSGVLLMPTDHPDAEKHANGR